jgi:hypothetical protein
MILLLVIAAWIVVLSLIAALCAAARVGDREPLTRANAPTGSGQAEPLVWEPAEHGKIAAHANARAVHSAQADASLLRSSDMAA